MKPEDEADPIDSREEFEKRIKASTCWHEDLNIYDILSCIIDQNDVELQRIRYKKKSCIKHVEKLLAEYDSMSSREERAKFVGSIRKFKYEENL